MASEAQVLANRRNAEKSTGPRTTEGKATSSQNAVKHGLLAQRCVIRTEDPEEFDAFRTQMLGQLAPAGAMETVLAERIVSLSWRLKRVERMQNEALDCLLAEEGESGELGSFEPTGDPALGRAVVKDFGGDRALERLMVYERRIEHSLYKTISELDRMKMLGSFDAEERRRYRDLMYGNQGAGGRDQGTGVGRPYSARPDLNPDPRTPAPDPRPLTPAFKTNPIPAGSEAWRARPAGVGAPSSAQADSACCVTTAG